MLIFELSIDFWAILIIQIKKIIYGGISISGDEGDFRINSIHNSLIKVQVKTSTSNDLHNCPGTRDNLKTSHNEIKAGKSQRTVAKLANKKIHLIYNS